MVFVVGSLQRGGAERQVLLLARGLARRGRPVEVWLLRGDAGGRADAAGLGVFPVRVPRARELVTPWGWVTLWSSWRACRQRLRSERPAVVHAWLFWAHVWAWLVVPRGSGRMVFSKRRVGSDAPGIFAAWDTWLYRHADAVVTNVRRLARRRGWVYLPNAVDFGAIDAVAPVDRASLAPGIDPAAPLAVTVANLLRQKGYRTLLLAWRRVVSEFPAARLICVGRDDGLGEQLRGLAERLGIGGAVIFTGARNDAVGIVKAADLYIQSSDDEGTSNALLEAMAAGRAVVATDVGGTRDVVDAESLVPSRAPGLLAERIVALFRDGNRRIAHGLRNRGRVVARHDTEAVLDALEQVYDGV